MMKKCKGCGSFLQIKNKGLEGYSKNLENDICERCFRIKHYGEYKKVNKSNHDFVPILEKINNTNDLVILTIDVFLMNFDYSNIIKYLKNDILLVLTKRDILPYSLKDEKLLEYIDKLNIPYIDKIVISSNKNYLLDELLEKIKLNQKSNNVYIVGYTNAGKSTLINKMIYHYSDLEDSLTTSILPSTTLNMIEIKLNDSLTLIDTPGILESNSIINYLDSKELKRILPSKEIKPITYQVKGKQFIGIDEFAFLELVDNNVTLFFSNALKIERFYKDNKKVSFYENVIRVKENQDVVISGLGFIKVMKRGIIRVFTLEGVFVYTRDSLI